MKIDKIKQTIDTIIRILEDSNFNDETDNTGYFTIDKKKFVDVIKATDEETPHYILYCLYEDNTCDMMYTETLSTDELENALQEFFNS